MLQGGRAFSRFCWHQCGRVADAENAIDFAPPIRVRSMSSVLAPQRWRMRLSPGPDRVSAETK